MMPWCPMLGVDGPNPQISISSLCGDEVQRHAIDAIALVGGRRPIIENMSEVTATGGAVDFRSHHAEAPIQGRFHRSSNGIIEARPAGSTFEFEF